MGTTSKGQAIFELPLVLFSDEKMMETIDHAVGPEKYELLAKQQGNDVSIFPILVSSFDPRHQRAIEMPVNPKRVFRK